MRYHPLFTPSVYTFWLWKPCCVSAWWMNLFSIKSTSSNRNKIYVLMVLFWQSCSLVRVGRRLYSWLKNKTDSAMTWNTLFLYLWAICQFRGYHRSKLTLSEWTYQSLSILDEKLWFRCLFRARYAKWIHLFLRLTVFLSFFPLALPIYLTHWLIA